jgi:hypothetical protein
MIGLIYRYRWQVELYFKWLKTMLPCGHWLAESLRGATSQIYTLLLAALLLLYGPDAAPPKGKWKRSGFSGPVLRTPTHLPTL